MSWVDESMDARDHELDMLWDASPTLADLIHTASTPAWLAVLPETVWQDPRRFSLDPLTTEVIDGIRAAVRQEYGAATRGGLLDGATWR